MAAVFALYGTVLGTWTSRIPAVKAHLALSDGRLSIALLAFAVGSIVGMQVGGRVVDRFGSAGAMSPALSGDAVLLVGVGYAPSIAALVVCLAVFGLTHGVLNVAMNVNALDVQRVLGRPIITSFHATYSIGGFLGAAIGGLSASFGRSAPTTFEVTGVVAALGAASAHRWFLRAGDTDEQHQGVESVSPLISDADTAADFVASAGGDTDRRLRPTASLLFLGGLVFCCLVGEGAAADWGSVYLRELGTSAGLAASAYGAFAVMMTVGRLAGDALVARFGPVNLVRTGGILAGVGFGAGLLVHGPVAALVGFASLGAGLSCIAPQVFSAAGSRDPARAGYAISRVAGLGFLGFVIGPIAIGASAQVIGLGSALAIPALLALFVGFAAPALRTAESER